MMQKIAIKRNIIFTFCIENFIILKMACNASDQQITLEEGVIQSDDGPSQPKRQKTRGRVSGGGESAVWEHYSKTVEGNKCKVFVILINSILIAKGLKIF